MRIAFAALSDLFDVKRGSGTWYHLANELERQGLTVTRVGPFALNPPVLARFNRAIHQRFRRRYLSFLDPLVAKRTAIEVDARLSDLDFSIVLTNDPGIAAFSRTVKPVVLYTDVMITPTYAERLVMACRLSNMSPFSLALSRMTLRRSLRRSAVAIFPTEWSAQAARSYCAQPEKIRMIPFGANVEDPGEPIARSRSWERVRTKGCCDLLFVGKDWVRKGGDVAVTCVRLLNERGMKARLHVVGATVPVGVPSAEVITHGVLDKSVPDQAELLRCLYCDSDVFILPSVSEGYVISVLEAAAFGLPVLAYDADGVRDAVVPGETGLLFPLGSPAEVFSEAVFAWAGHPTVYASLALGARRHYETSGNWRSSAAALKRELTMMAAGRSPGRPLQQLPYATGQSPSNTPGSASIMPSNV